MLAGWTGLDFDWTERSAVQAKPSHGHCLNARVQTGRGGRDSNTPKLLDSRHFATDSRRQDGTRIDVSAREVVDVGPSATEVAATLECALATALARAAEAGQWNVVVQLARELEARRLACPEVAVVAGHQPSG